MLAAFNAIGGSDWRERLAGAIGGIEGGKGKVDLGGNKPIKNPI
jgi:hypothetical protein